jgi:DNA invertase Pin-like site-specific DNA recombinase
MAFSLPSFGPGWNFERLVAAIHKYAVRKGWRVDDNHVYVDDGISGAEFANRPGFLRLMNALKPRPSFQVLIMRGVTAWT